MDRFPKTALCQINPTVGDLKGNRDKICEYIKKAQEKGAELICFPELSLTGYPPKDLLLKTRFLTEQRQKLEEIARITKEAPVIVGCVDFEPRDEVVGQNLYDLAATASVRWRLYNSAAVLRDGKIERYIHKAYLPNYDIYDEQRYFDTPQKVASHLSGDPESKPHEVVSQPPGDPARNTPTGDSAGSKSIIELNSGIKVGITICEDIWVEQGPAAHMKGEGVEVLLNISASPYYKGKLDARLRMLGVRARQAGIPLIYVNLVGGQDDLIFDGRSLAANPEGRLTALAKSFCQDMLIYQGETEEIIPKFEETEELWEALKLGLSDYARKNGFSKAILGISGGIDSAVVAALAAQALGPENVLGLVMPSRFTSRLALKDAQLLCNNLGISSEPIPIDDLYATHLETLKPYFEDTRPGTAEQNVQARIRGNLLMAFSNKFGHLVLACGNKSELAVGYVTLYGDMSGGLSPIGDVPKTTVYKLAQWFNQREGTDQIPARILTRAPSAELAPGQKDSDDLPHYELLDKVLELYIEHHLSSKEIIEKGFEEKLVHRIIGMVDAAEYKRRQSAPILKITPRAFGFGRRMPITNRYQG